MSSPSALAANMRGGHFGLRLHSQPLRTGRINLLGERPLAPSVKELPPHSKRSPLQHPVRMSALLIGKPRQREQEIAQAIEKSDNMLGRRSTARAMWRRALASASPG